MLQGVGRSLDQVYRQVINDEWAEAYDEELRRVSLKEKKEALRLTRSHSVEAVERIVTLMRRELKGPDGELVR
jgi:hypothetical protein